MAVFITHYDLQPFIEIELVKATAMIDDVEAMAITAAPCLADPDTVLTDNQRATVRAVLRTVLIRWAQAGSGALTQETTGPFAVTYDTRTTVERGLLRPSEISELQAICGSPGGQAFTFDTLGRQRLAEVWDPFGGLPP